MKKLLVTVLMITMLTTIMGCANATPASDSAALEEAETPSVENKASDEANPSAVESTSRIGVLSFLNLTEEQYAAIIESRFASYDYLKKNGVLEGDLNNDQDAPDLEVKYYDTLDSMIMALQSGEVDSLDLPQNTARYLCANNDNLEMPFTIDLDKAAERLIYKDLVTRAGNVYSFMMLEDREELREEFNGAIEAMVQDGTLDALKKKYISEVIDGKEMEKIEFESFDGEPVRVALSGSLPPMDYVAADGTFAGFNTAMLSEIGRRLKKNIELVQVDSLGRAAALSSGNVDVVFWTRGTPYSSMNEKEREEDAARRVKEKEEQYTEEEQEIWKDITATRNIDRNKDGDQDMPEGAIVTRSYLTDAIVIVRMKDR